MKARRGKKLQREDVSIEKRQEIASDLLRKHVMWSMGVGLVPIPLVDFLAVTGIQLNMLYGMCKIYSVKFSRDVAKNIIAVLIGGILPSSSSRSLASLVKLVPLVGETVGAMTMPIVSGASTYAIGKVFIQHFESGGTFLNFDPAAVKEYFAEEFRKGKKVSVALGKDNVKQA